MNAHRIKLLAPTLLVALIALGVYLHAGRAHADPTTANMLPAGSARLTIYQTQLGHIYYTEGSHSYLRITPAHGRSTTVGFIQSNRPAFSRPLAPGRYTITSWQRPCDGSCSFLDPPVDRCQATFEAPEATTTALVVKLRPGHGCRIVFRNGR
jgi:hypothetical protein